MSNGNLETFSLLPWIAAPTIALKHGRCPKDNFRGQIPDIKAGLSHLEAAEATVLAPQVRRSRFSHVVLKIVEVAQSPQEAAAVGPRFGQAHVGSGGLQLNSLCPEWRPK